MAGMPTIPVGGIGNIVIDSSKLMHIVDMSSTIKKFKADGFVTHFKSYPNMTLIYHSRKKILTAFAADKNGNVVNKRYGILSIKYYTYPVNRRVVSNVATLEMSDFYDDSIDDILGGDIEKLGGGL